MFATYREAADFLARAGIKPGDPLATSLAEAREQQDRYFQGLNGEIPSVAQVCDLQIPGDHGAIGLRLSRPSTSARLPCVLFIRGAGWWAGGLESHARTINSLALKSGCVVCAVDYSRCPESAYPTQRDEILTALAWLRANADQHGIDGDRYVLFGESAGATLCLSVALSLRDSGDRSPSGLVLFYPNAAASSSRTYSQWVWRNYIGRADPTAVPGPVPMLQDMRGLPPVWIGCGEDDPLMKDTLALAEKLAAAEVPHSVVRYPGLPHAFVMLSRLLQPASDALQQAADVVRDFNANLR